MFGRVEREYPTKHEIGRSIYQSYWFFLTNRKYHLLIMLFEYKAVFLCLGYFGDIL